MEVSAGDRSRVASIGRTSERVPVPVASRSRSDPGQRGTHQWRWQLGCNQVVREHAISASSRMTLIARSRSGSWGTSRRSASGTISCCKMGSIF